MKEQTARKSLANFERDQRIAKKGANGSKEIRVIRIFQDKEQIIRKALENRSKETRGRI